MTSVLQENASLFLLFDVSEAKVTEFECGEGLWVSSATAKVQTTEMHTAV